MLLLQQRLQLRAVHPQPTPPSIPPLPASPTPSTPPTLPHRHCHAATPTEVATRTTAATTTSSGIVGECRCMYCCVCDHCQSMPLLVPLICLLSLPLNLASFQRILVSWAYEALAAGRSNLPLWPGGRNASCVSFGFANDLLPPRSRIPNQRPTANLETSRTGFPGHASRRRWLRLECHVVLLDGLPLARLAISAVDQGQWFEGSLLA